MDTELALTALLGEYIALDQTAYACRAELSALIADAYTDLGKDHLAVWWRSRVADWIECQQAAALS